MLNTLSDRPGAFKKRTRVGRGIGSTKGKTCGRGVKGQKSRSGVAIKGFEGGQMPIYMRLPKRGFHPHNSLSYEVVNLGRIQKAIDGGRLDVGGTVDSLALKEAGLVKGTRVRLLGKGTLGVPVVFKVTGVSKAARTAVEAQGGSVTLQGD